MFQLFENDQACSSARSTTYIVALALSTRSELFQLEESNREKVHLKARREWKISNEDFINSKEDKGADKGGRTIDCYSYAFINKCEGDKNK